MTNAEIIKHLMFSTQQLWIFHVQTEKYAQHIALGEAYQKVQDFMDFFTENQITQTGTRESLAVQQELAFEDYANGSSCIAFIDELLKFLIDTINDVDFSDDVVNKRQDLQGDLNKTQYMLGLA